MAKRTRKAAFMISAVAQSYNIHPQTLRLYEREGLLKPSRTEGNTRLYTEADVQRLEVILSLTRDLGVNLAGVEVVLNMREKMEEMQRQMREFVSMVQHEFARPHSVHSEIKNALVRFVPRHSAPVRVIKKRS
jgi:MerR family transcriptional regulator/heat shock protein HspR